MGHLEASEEVSSFSENKTEREERGSHSPLEFMAIPTLGAWQPLCDNEVNESGKPDADNN